MEVPGNISATAFVACQARARLTGVSKDEYARLWVTPEVVELWDDYTKNVYAHDDLEISLRCRFFLDRLRAFVKHNVDPVFISIAAGFTSYPFLVDPSCTCVETDYEHIVAFKRRQVDAWQAQGVLPPRRVEFHPADLERPEDLSALERSIAPRVGRRPSFVLLEGITYYWDAALLKKTLDLFRDTQTRGSMIAFDFWRPEIVHDPVFVRLEGYLSERFGFAARTYNLFGSEFVASLDGYEIVELTDVIDQEKVYCGTTTLQNRDDRLLENYTVIRKT